MLILQDNGLYIESEKLWERNMVRLIQKTKWDIRRTAQEGDLNTAKCLHNDLMRLKNELLERNQKNLAGLIDNPDLYIHC